MRGKVIERGMRMNEKMELLEERNEESEAVSIHANAQTAKNSVNNI